MDTHVARDPFSALDRASVRDAWFSDLSIALLELYRSIGSIDQNILAPLTALVTRYTPFLNEQAGRQAHVGVPTGIADAYPACSTLFGFRKGYPGGLELLVAIGLCALVEATGADRERVVKFLATLRGALKSTASDLSLAFGSVASIPDLVRAVESGWSTGRVPERLRQPWDGWIRSTVARWMLADPERMRRALEPVELVPAIDGPVIPITETAGEPDSVVSLDSYQTPPSDAEGTESASDRSGRAKSDHLERKSQGDLLAPADFRLPPELDERLCIGSVVRARECIEEDPTRAESYIALALAMAGGLREIDLRHVRWGGEEGATHKSCCIDPALPVLYRRLQRPPDAVQPPPELASWLEPSLEVLAWPLPPSVHALLQRLAAGNPSLEGRPVLPYLSQSPAASYRLLNVIDQVLPGVQVGSLPPRLALAARIGEAFGPEIAQLSMADTFSMSAIPAYYSALPEADVVTWIANDQARRFQEEVIVGVARSACLGSRLVLTDAAARRWAEQIASARKIAASTVDSRINEWRAHRDRLAAMLCCATGHRPEDAIGAIGLGDVIPEYRLVLLQDKQADALRAMRVAATGRLWVSVLRRFLDRLIEIERELGKEPAGKIAADILRCKLPLFTVPGPEGEAERMSGSALRQTMPPELRPVDNFYRHRLNQFLLRKRVDPEARHAQLGWVVSSAHFNADLSPRAPKDLAEVLGPAIDDLLVADGWCPASARKTRWHWDGVPMPEARDWDAVFATSKRQHEDNVRSVRLKMQERWKELEPAILARLATAFGEVCPLLRVDQDKRRLVSIQSAGTIRVELKSDHHALIIDRVRQDDTEPASALEWVMARILLYRLVRRARTDGLVVGPIPGRPYLSVTSDPSPFVPGLGIAVRQSLAVRDALAAASTPKWSRGMGALIVWSVLAFSMYRRMSWALAATRAAKDAVRAKHRSHVLRVPAVVEGAEFPMAFGGVPAALMARRKQQAPTALVPTKDELESWALSYLSGSIAWGGPGAAATRIEKTLWAAAQVELSGIERWLLQAREPSSAESSLRCLARDDNWPTYTADPAEAKDSDAVIRQPTLVEETPRATGSRERRRMYDRFVGLLNKRTLGRLQSEKRASRGRKASDGTHGWRSALRGELERVREDARADRNLVILISYSLDHLRHGSEDGNRLEQNSLQREVSQFGWPMLSLLGERSLLALGAEDLRKLYQSVICSKSDASKAFVFEEIRRFHRYLIRVHAIPSVPMQELAILAGARKQSVDPGLLTRLEIRATLDVLANDTELERLRPDASPDFVRLSMLRKLLFLILEASGIRPGSAYGLTLGDLHLLGEGRDYVHVREGDFGEAKTKTSIGFVPLEGELWSECRSTVLAWVDEQRKGLAAEDWTAYPLFAERMGLRTRFEEHHLTQRINQLLKWSSNQPKAREYWLRKVRITQRYHALQCELQPTARDVYAAMMRSGHAAIQTPMAHYINDAACVLYVDLRDADEAPRAALLAMSAVPLGGLDVQWSRCANDRHSRTSVLLDRMGHTVMEAPEGRRADPPPLRRFRPFLPLHVDAYARAMHRYKDRTEAILAAGVTDEQAARLDQSAFDLLTRRGCTPWRLQGQQHVRSTLRVPRALEGTDELFDLLRKRPSADLLRLANAWVDQAGLQRSFESNVLLQLTHGDELRAGLELAGLDREGLQVTMIDGRHVLRERLHDDQRKGHGATLRWLFAIMTIYSSLGSAAPISEAA